MVDRTKFILNISAEYFALPTSVNATDSATIKEFIENVDNTILVGVAGNDERLHFLHHIPTDESSLIFYKISNGRNGSSAALESLPPLGMLTLDGGLVKSIYYSLQRVYSPNVTKTAEYSPQVSQLIQTLQSSLSASLMLPQSGIQSVDEEIYFWKQVMENSATKSERDKATSFVEALENLNGIIRQFDGKSQRSLVDFFDSIHTGLDELWRLPHNFPQNRMIDLMDIVCSVVIDLCTDSLNNEDIFNQHSMLVTDKLIEVSENIDSYLHVCDMLTRVFWPNNGAHLWVGTAHVPPQAGVYQERIADIKSIKLMYQQISSVFVENGQPAFNVRAMFEPFKAIRVLDTTPLGSKVWKAAKYRFEILLQPIEEKLALMLKAKIQAYIDNPRQIVFIFSKHDAILRRSAIMKHLTGERDQFMHSLKIMVKETKAIIHENNFQQDDNMISPLCSACRYLKILEHQIKEINEISHLIEDHDEYPAIAAAIKEVQEDVESTLKSNLEQWVEQSLALVSSGELTLKDDQPVVEFERTDRQLMQVTFKPNLFTFCHDLRELVNFDFRVPIELRDTATNAQRFIGYVRRLQQIATFHNTIGDRMIPCQRPIMLKNALELSRLVQSESVAWNDEESIQRYMATLQDAVSKLAHDNTFLYGQHEEVKRVVMRLMNVDLQRQAQVWKDEMRRLREIFTALETKSYQNLHGFKLHWDHQLYKVLEHQYMAGLSDLNNRLPDIYLDIVFRQQELQFRPPMEEIRSKYFNQLRRFLERPLGFRGLSDQSNNIFKIMVKRNRNLFSEMYKRGEDLFKQLVDVLDLWLPWVALGMVNMKDLCSVHLSVWEDWDRNFKACKHFSQQVAKIQGHEIRIDCFVINLTPLRSDIESISRKYWETLANSLRISILNDISVLQDFLQTSLQVLQNVPFDEVGIAEAGAKYERIISELPKMTEQLRLVEGKDTCLSGWCKERVSSLAAIVVQWDQLQPLIVSHSVVLQRQIDIMRDHVETQMVNLQEVAEKFQIRWESTMTELRDNEQFNVQLFRDRQLNWTAIKDQREQLENDCAKYNISFSPELRELFTAVDKSVQEQSLPWDEYAKFLDDFEQIGCEDWSVYRRKPYILTDFLMSWRNQLASSSRATTTTIADARIRQRLDGYQTAMPILQSLQSDGLTETHWARFFTLMQKSPKPFHDITLMDVLQNGPMLITNADEIQGLVRQAGAEQIVVQALSELEQWGVTAVLKTVQQTDSNGQSVTLIKDFRETLNKIGDNQCLLQAAKNSTSIEKFSDQAEIWESRLANLDYILTSLSQTQRKWIYLEPIFNNGTMKSDEGAFKRIDKDFRYIMREISGDNRLLSLIKINNIATVISSLENQLSRCQQTLTHFITTKRNAFPRFYFISDDDLLEILGQSTRPEVIQKHISKLFPGISSLQLQERNSVNYIECICSAEGDVVRLNNEIALNVPIVDWLNQLVAEVKGTLSRLIVACAKYDQFNIEHISTYPVQVLCTAKAIIFTRQTEVAIGQMAIAAHLKSIRREIDLYSSVEFKKVDELSALKIRSLLLDLVHYASTLEYLQAESVTINTDWCWLQQMKFYFGSNQTVCIKMVYAEFEYSYEYLGNTNKLVNTTLTHNCYLTLCMAMHLGLGGNPFGPAGTGKTECVKSLGAMLGRLVLVFNCNENVDTEAMSLILSGLARCGAWGCFDEFNRLQEATLSAISMLIQPLQMAIKDKKTTVQMSTDQIQLNPHCAIFVTLNPAGEEYKGRQQLPANLQALFRPIVMQQPRPKEIARVLLFAEHFKYANEIGDSVVEVFNVAKQILSPQRHYDWGLRELRTVLQACGRILNDCSTEIQLEDERQFAVHALRSNTMSKLTVSDCKRFEVVIGNVFPNVVNQMGANEQLRALLLDSFGTLGLQMNQRQLEKCLQLYEQLNKRMGVVILGPAGSGKTTIVALLKQALTTWSKIIKTHIIAPKSMTRVQLLGSLDPDTRQWNDGVLTTTAIQVNNEPDDVNSWIICDGDVDPEWIEALNSVLDDNKLLTLPSGWRIKFGNNVNFIFETHDLLHASPATISRMGIITLSTEDLNESEIIEMWLTKHKIDENERNLIHQYLPASLDWVVDSGDRALKTSRISLAQCALTFVRGAKSKEELCVSLLRGLGSTLASSDINRFSTFIFELLNVYTPNMSKCELCFYNSTRDAIELYETDQDVAESMDQSKPKIKLIFTGHMKVYMDVVRQFLLTDENAPFLIIGPPGTAKSLLLETVTADLSGFDLVTINCSTQLTADFVLYTLKQNCLTISGLRGREYRSRHTKMVLYLKNINLCSVDEWGTCEIIELLLQIIQRKGFYDPIKLEWVNVNGLQICGSMLDRSGDHLSPRFISITRQLVMGYPTEQDMHVIVKDQITPVLMQFKQDMRMHEEIVNAIINIYSSVKSAFTKAQQIHYAFSPKMITNVIYGLMNYSGQDFSQAFYNEMVCVFRNRLIHATSLEMFDDIWQENCQILISKTISNHTQYFAPTGAKMTDQQLVDSDEWQQIIQRNITTCATEDIYMETPITIDLLTATTVICRALSRHETNLLLCGPIGCGRNEALHIACSILGTKIATPIPVQNYSMPDFYNDLKAAIQVAALDDQSVVMHLDHVWLVYLPDIMKPIEAILEGSEIPDLFKDDLETIAAPLRAAAQMDDYQGSIVSYFWQRVKSNLHIVLTLESSSGSSNISDLFKRYPCLYGNMEMFFIQAFSDDSLSAYPDNFYRLKHIGEPIPMPKMSTLLTGQWSSSPLRFKHLVRTYISVYAYFLQKLQSQRDKLKAGVDKLSAAHEVVGTLRSQAQSQELALAEKKKLANQALEMISFTMRSAQDQRTDLLGLKEKTQESSERLMERKRAIELELKEVEPILKEATAAVGQIKGEALSEIRSLRAPPEIIRDILEGVLRLMGTRDTSWNSMKSFLAKRGIKEDIRSLDPVRITPENCLAVERLLAAKSESFEQKNAKRASAAAAPLAAWVIANVKYSKVIQSIKPLEREQNMLQLNLEQSEGEMKSLISGLDDVDARVKELSVQLNVYTQEAALLEIKLNEARSTLNAAEVLVEKLSSEYSNWKQQMEELDESLGSLEQKSLLISMSITHLSHYTYDTRRSYLNQLVFDLGMNNFDLTKNLITDQDKIVWESIGLTADVQSMENAAILSKVLQLPFGSAPIPLLLDPSGSALEWLQEYLKLQNIDHEISAQGADRFTYTLELAVRFGKCLVVRDYQSNRPPLLSILLGTIHSRFNKKMLQVGAKLIDFHENFKLVLVTTMTTANNSNEIAAYLTAIPFTTTVSGYTDQLMTKCIQLKKPELEIKRVELLQNEGKSLKTLSDLQDKLLLELYAAKGNILENDVLLTTLNEVKQSSDSIDKSITESSQVRSKLMEEYNQYRGLCEEAAHFFIGFSSIYNLSVTNFTTLFIKSINSQEDFDQLSSISQLARHTFTMLSHSIPKSDHTMLSLHLCHHAFPTLVPEKEWELFINNFISDLEPSSSIPSWIRSDSVQKLTVLQSELPDFYRRLDLDNRSQWSEFFNESNTSPEVPVKITEFQRIMVTQLFRPEHLLAAIGRSTMKLLGLKTMSVVKPTIQLMAEESVRLKTILLLSTGDIDPSAQIREYVKTSIGTDKYEELSMGRGIETTALSAIQKAAKDGSWICLKNVHLMSDWLRKLDQTLDSIESAGGQPSFRLWLVANSTASFPVSLLAKCNKTLFEAPTGVKPKIFRLLQQFLPSITESRKDAKQIRLYILLFILNAVLQERRSYIPQGWTKWYDFGDSDLRTAIAIVGWMEKSVQYKVDWSVLQGLCKHIAFGGRIDTDQDLGILMAHLRAFFDQKSMDTHWSPLQLKLRLPQSQNAQEYLSAIAQLPDDEQQPAALGLSATTNASRDLLIAQNVLKKIRNIHFANDDTESFEKSIKPILGMWKKLYSGTTVVKTCASLTEPTGTDSETPWKMFVVTELQLAAQLFQTIHSTLVTLHAAIRGTDTMSAAVRQTIMAIRENHVPLMWRKLWPGPRLVTDFIKAAITRGIAAERRYRSTDGDKSFGDRISFGEIFNLEGFMSALKLTNAKEIQKSSSQLRVMTNLMKSNGFSAKLSSPTVEPLMIDGASFRNNNLTMLATTSAAVSMLPEFQIHFDLQPDDALAGSGNRYDKDTIELPLYANVTREHLICMIKVNTTVDVQTVVLAGVALIVPESG